MNRNLIYQALYHYDINSEVDSYFIDTWEYDNELLIRKTNIDSHTLSNYQYFDEKYYYNESNQKIKSECYDESGNLLGYGLFLYNEDNVLYRFEGYSTDDILSNYMLIEDTCN